MCEVGLCSRLISMSHVEGFILSAISPNCQLGARAIMCELGLCSRLKSMSHVERFILSAISLNCQLGARAGHS